jgi:hypothetical protein
MVHGLGEKSEIDAAVAVVRAAGGTDVRWVPGDLSTPQGVEEMMGAAGEIDILVSRKASLTRSLTHQCSPSTTRLLTRLRTHSPADHCTCTPTAAVRHRAGEQRWHSTRCRSGRLSYGQGMPSDCECCMSCTVLGCTLSARTPHCRCSPVDMFTHSLTHPLNHIPSSSSGLLSLRST